MPWTVLQATEIPCFIHKNKVHWCQSRKDIFSKSYIIHWLLYIWLFPSFFHTYCSYFFFLCGFKQLPTHFPWNLLFRLLLFQEVLSKPPTCRPVWTSIIFQLVCTWHVWTGLLNHYICIGFACQDLGLYDSLIESFINLFIHSENNWKLSMSWTVYLESFSQKQKIIKASIIPRIIMDFFLFLL